MLFPTSDDDLLISVYRKQSRTLDDLPYTQEFEAIHEAAIGDGATSTSRAQLFRRLHNLRKAGKLPRLGRATTPPLKIAPEQEAMLASLVEEKIGRLSLRDQLLYTPAFDEIVSAFNAKAALNLSAHDAWRIVAKLAK